MASKERQGVPKEHLACNAVAKFMRDEGMEPTDTVTGIEPARHLAPIIVAAKGKHVLPCHLKNVVDVAQHVFRRRIGMTVGDEVAAIIETHDPLTRRNLAHLPIS